jgi:dihydroxyacetone kinase-like protein
MFRAGMQGMAMRGGAQVGDKTMLDALDPAVDELERSAQDGAPLRETLRRAAAAARNGADATRTLIARKGKARYLGERALGHPDAGAQTIAVILHAMADLPFERPET